MGLSGGLSPFRASKTEAYTRSLFRPCPGRRVEKPGRLSSKASTEAAVCRRWRSVADRSRSDLLFSGAGGRGVGHDEPWPIACQCVSLAFRSDGHSHQLGAFCNERKENSVAAVTDDCDDDQTRFIRPLCLDAHRTIGLGAVVIAGYGCEMKGLAISLLPPRTRAPRAGRA